MPHIISCRKEELPETLKVICIHHPSQITLGSVNLGDQLECGQPSVCYPCTLSACRGRRGGGVTSLQWRQSHILQLWCSLCHYLFPCFTNTFLQTSWQDFKSCNCHAYSHLFAVPNVPSSFIWRQLVWFVLFKMLLLSVGNNDTGLFSGVILFVILCIWLIIIL